MSSIATIWNRVILLVSGFIIGWNLSNYWTAAPEQVSHQRNRLWMGAVLGLAMLVWLAIDEPATAVFGLMIVLLTAFVAYMGSAREASGTPEPWPRPRPLRKSALHDEILVVLVSFGEPASYDGPASWAWQLAWLAGLGEKVPSWFSRPRVYARIRKAITASGEQGSLDAWVTDLQTALTESLSGSFACIKGYEFVKPGLASTLAHAAEDGYTRFVLLPLGPIDEAAVSAAIKHSRIKEVGVQVLVMQPEQPLGWDQAFAVERLQLLMSGRPAQAPAVAPQEYSKSLDELIRAEAFRKGWDAQVEPVASNTELR